MKTKRETLPPGEEKSTTDLPKSTPQTKTGVKKWCVSKTHDWTYRSVRLKIRVPPRSHTSSPANSPGEQVKGSNGTAPVTSTAASDNVPLEGTGEEEETEMGGAPPSDSSGILPVGTCYKCGPMSACKPQWYACWKAGCHYADFRYHVLNSGSI